MRKTKNKRRTLKEVAKKFFNEGIKSLPLKRWGELNFILDAMTTILENANSLAFDAKVLFDNKRYRGALNSAILSAEELGKFTIFFEIWYTVEKQRITKDDQIKKKQTIQESQEPSSTKATRHLTHDTSIYKTRSH